MDSTEALNACKKRKLNSSLKAYTYPSPNKAIHPLKSKSSDKIKVNITNKKIDSGNKIKVNIANKNSDSSYKTKVKLANKNKLNSHLSKKTKLHIADKNKSRNLVKR